MNSMYTRRSQGAIWCRGHRKLHQPTTHRQGGSIGSYPPFWIREHFCPLSVPMSVSVRLSVFGNKNTQTCVLRPRLLRWCFLAVVPSSSGLFRWLNFRLYFYGGLQSTRDVYARNFAFIQSCQAVFVCQAYHKVDTFYFSLTSCAYAQPTALPLVCFYSFTFPRRETCWLCSSQQVNAKMSWVILNSSWYYACYLAC